MGDELFSFCGGRGCGWRGLSGPLAVLASPGRPLLLRQRTALYDSEIGCQDMTLLGLINCVLRRSFSKWCVDLRQCGLLLCSPDFSVLFCRLVVMRFSL